MDGRLHTTGTAAIAANCTESFVRQCEKRGVIRPRRDESGRRLLSDADVEKLREMRQARGVAA